MAFRLGARGSRVAKAANKAARFADSLKADGAIADDQIIHEQVQAESFPCSLCGEVVHPDNWTAHVELYHADSTVIRIDAAFRALIPPLAPEEITQLEANLIAEGCRDPLVVWQHEGKRVLVDGHNRFSLCQKHRIAFTEIVKDFNSRADVEIWIIQNQLGRRNINGFVRAELALRMKDAIAAIAKETQGTRTDIFQNSGRSLHTDKALAKAADVSHDTIHKVEVVTKDAPDSIKKKARSGAISTHRAYELTQALKDAADEVQAVVEAYGITEPETVKMLAQLHKSAQRDGSSNTFEEVAASGYVQPGEDHEAVAITDTPLRIKGALELKAKTHRQLARDYKFQHVGLPNAKYRVIYADPPWKYGNTMPDYFTEQADHYPLMSLDEICALPIKDLCEENAVLFLWVTSPILAESFRVVTAWGFDYKACFVWDKIKHNMGHYNSVRHEFLLICVRGSCQPDVAKLFDSVVSVERTAHSEKPEEFRQMIDTLYPHGKRIELFARRKSDRWDVYGNQIPT